MIDEQQKTFICPYCGNEVKDEVNCPCCDGPIEAAALQKDFLDQMNKAFKARQAGYFSSAEWTYTEVLEGLEKNLSEKNLSDYEAMKDLVYCNLYCCAERVTSNIGRGDEKEYDICDYRPELVSEDDFNKNFLDKCKSKAFLTKIRQDIKNIKSSKGSVENKPLYDVYIYADEKDARAVKIAKKIKIKLLKMFNVYQNGDLNRIGGIRNKNKEKEQASYVCDTATVMVFVGKKGECNQNIDKHEEIIRFNHYHNETVAAGNIVTTPRKIEKGAVSPAKAVKRAKAYVLKNGKANENRRTEYYRKFYRMLEEETKKRWPKGPSISKIKKYKKMLYNFEQANPTRVKPENSEE